MNYYNPYNYGYPSYQVPPTQPLVNQTPQQQTAQVPQPQQSGIIWVQGEAGAKSYLVAPGTQVILMDSESQTFYIKSTDQNGIPQPLKIYDFQERVAKNDTGHDATVDLSQYVTKDELKTILEGLKNG